MKFRKAIAATVMLLSFGMATGRVFAAEDSEDNTPVITLGDSLSDNQRKETLNVLKGALSDSSSYNTLSVTGSDLVAYLNPSGNSFTSDSGVWSSAAIEKASSGSGINVKVLDYDGQNNITSITPDQYRNAALTAGIKDANIFVTSAKPIDGSGALAGIYKAYAKSGNKLNQNQITAAQDELNTLSGINGENNGKDGYSDAQLNNAVAGAKKAMAGQGSGLSKDQIQQIVDDQLNKNGLGNALTDGQKQQIINLLVEIEKSGALSSPAFQQQVGQVMNAIQNHSGEIKSMFNQLNTVENRNALQKLWDAFIQFLSSIRLNN